VAFASPGVRPSSVPKGQILPDLSLVAGRHAAGGFLLVIDAQTHQPTSSTGSPSPSLQPVLPEAAYAAFAFHHPSQGTQHGHWAIRRWLDTDGNVVRARAMLSRILVASQVERKLLRWGLG
jgi:hypothetical protein